MKKILGDATIKERILIIGTVLLCTVSIIMSILYVWKSMENIVPFTTTQVQGNTQVMQGENDVDNNRATTDNDTSDEYGDTPNNTSNSTNTANIPNQTGGIGNTGLSGQPAVTPTPSVNAGDTTLENTEFSETIYGSLIVTNHIEVRGEEALEPDLEKEFHITIHVGEEIYEHGLKAGESYRVENIPAGMEYNIEVADYLADNYVNEHRHLNGNIGEGENHVNVINALTPRADIDEMLAAGLLSSYEDNAGNMENIEGTGEMNENLLEQELQEAEVIAPVNTEIESVQYTGEAYIHQATHSTALTVWVVMLMISTVMLKVILKRFD